MDRRRLIEVIAGGLLASPLVAAAQPVAKVARIGYLATNLVAGDARTRESFLQGLHDLGYVEGVNLLIEYRDAVGKSDRFPLSPPSWLRSRLMSS